MRLRHLILPLVLLASACSAEVPVRKGEGPVLWKLSDADTTIYLFGTIHALPKGLKWRTATIDQAVAASQELWLETTLDKVGTETLQAMLDMGTDEAVPSITLRVAPAKREALEAMIKRSGYPRPLFDQLETWAAGFVLTAVSMRDLGLDGLSGVEEQLSVDFTKAGKPIGGLETSKQQLGYFDDLPEDDQRRFLDDTLEDPKKSKVEFDAMLSAWAQGDEQAIINTFDDEMRKTKRLRQVLLVDRNRRWAGWVRERMKRPGTVMVAVGAGHLSGAGSVVDLLQSVGEKVERVE
ncbi:TraB/GumN family protein [Sphingomonas sp. ID0503]|uniref:TraB/GumN family protein n=1 Tax=Sphingomonas sp. ID0503 TaxID=3399691 RepID=UPI003AFA5E8F